MPVVELFGQARLLSGTRSIHVPGSTLKEALTALAELHPELIGPVLGPDGWPTAAYMLNVNGRRFCTDPGLPLRAEDELLVIASSSGG